VGSYQYLLFLLSPSLGSTLSSLYTRHYPHRIPIFWPSIAMGSTGISPRPTILRTMTGPHVSVRTAPQVAPYPVRTPVCTCPVLVASRGHSEKRSLPSSLRRRQESYQHSLIMMSLSLHVWTYENAMMRRFFKGYTEAAQVVTSETDTLRAMMTEDGRWKGQESRTGGSI